MKENLQHIKTTAIGAIMALVSLLQAFDLITAEQLNKLTSTIPVIGDKLIDLVLLAIGLFMMFKARDAKKRTTKNIL